MIGLGAIIFRAHDFRQLDYGGVDKVLDIIVASSVKKTQQLFPMTRE